MDSRIAQRRLSGERSIQSATVKGERSAREQQMPQSCFDLGGNGGEVCTKEDNLTLLEVKGLLFDDFHLHLLIRNLPSKCFTCPCAVAGPNPSKQTASLTVRQRGIRRCISAAVTMPLPSPRASSGQTAGHVSSSSTSSAKAPESDVWGLRLAHFV